MRRHLDLACVKLDSTQAQLNRTQEELRDTQDQLNNVLAQLNIAQEEFREATRKLEKKFNSSEEATRKLEERVNNSEEATRKLEEKVHSSEEATSKLGEKVNSSEEATRKLEKKVNSSEEATRKLEKKVNSSEVAFKETTRNIEEKITINGFKNVWKISGFSEVLRQAKSGEKPVLFSAPFEDYGYKFKLRLDPNGSGDGRNTHLSIYIVMMKGEFDALLPWPFHKKVTFVLIDQQENANDRKNIEISFTVDPKNHKETCARPVTDESTGRGYSEFVSHDKLKERRFIVEDTLFLQVKVGPPQ